MTIIVAQTGMVRTWTLNRPDRGNSLGPTMSAGLAAAMGDLKSEISRWESEKFAITSAPCRALVIRATPAGKNGTVWIAGGDLWELSRLEGKQDGKKYGEGLAEFLADVELLPIPVIAMITGAAIGGGAEFALAADLRFATARASFQFKQLNLGLCTGYGSCHRIVSALGLSRAKDLLFRQRSVTGKDLEVLGLAHAVVDSSAELESLVARTLEDVIAVDPGAFAAQKRLLNQAAQLVNSEHRLEESVAFASLWMENGHRTALSEFTKSRRGSSE